ncbi:transporter substrate-binding domain-containing protein [Vreelandella olivaria]|uniref:transporter substrate-binding domain-containing protein n=1 Tax=Vreelandella olivaria TaxID=390919 RepID=UPI00201F7634|nr:transporter substrate-binding domain-containing protein [Halomonas olivaria]
MPTYTQRFTKTFTTAVAVLGATAVLADSSHARDLEEIRNDVFQVVNSGAYPPFSYVDTQGNLVGFDVDVAEALAEKLGVEINVQSSPWNGIIAAMVAGRFDACICSMSITEERQQVLDFTDSYYSSGLSIWVHEETDDINSTDDFTAKQVGSTLGETGNQWAVENGEGKWRNQTFQGLPDMMSALNAGRIDIMIADDVPVLVAMQENEWGIKRVDVGEMPRWPAAIAIQQNRPELHNALNEALSELKADGTYQAIVDKWIGEGANIE